MKFHNDALKDGKVIILAQIFFHYDERKIANDIASLKALVAAYHIHFPVFYEVFHNFPKEKIDPWLYPETQPEFNPDDIIWDNMFNNIFRCIRIIERIHVNKPV